MKNIIIGLYPGVMHLDFLEKKSALLTERNILLEYRKQIHKQHEVQVKEHDDFIEREEFLKKISKNHPEYKRYREQQIEKALSILHERQQ